MNGNTTYDAGETITYDNIGNPTSYLGATLTWEGRQLTSYSKDDNTYNYEYDENGMRYRTTIADDEGNTEGSFEYVWVDGKLISLVYVSEDSTTTAKYLYNESDEPVGMVLTDDTGSVSTYYYLKNAQGDITNIVNDSGKKMVEFTYDVFGKIDEEYQANQNTTTGMLEYAKQTIVRILTPFGYRGYCYDTYTGLYYLQSRYYDPDTGRFINADDTNYLNVTGTVLGCNLFAYCENDAVNCVDESGSSPVSVAAKVLGFANDVLMAKSHYKDNKKLDKYVTGYINGQNFRPYCNYEYGVGTLDYNGCELIAIYNALQALGKARKLSKIIYDFEIHGDMWLNGVFGTKPQAIGSYIRSCGLKTKSFNLTSSMDKYVKNNRVFIICYAYANIGIHTVMAKGLKDGKIKIYNRYSNRNKTYTMDSIKKYVSKDGFKLIVGYYIYK